MNTFLGRAMKVWLLFSGEKGTDKISITLQSACCACHVAINNSYFDLMGYLLLMDFKELLQWWIYVLLSEVYRSQDEERHNITYSRSFSKPGVLKWVVSGILPFWSKLQLIGTLQVSRYCLKLQWNPQESMMDAISVKIQKFSKYSWVRKEKKLPTLGMW